jgi:hypothetical protein
LVSFVRNAIRRPRKPIAEHLFGGEPALVEPRPDGIAGFAVLLQIQRSEFCGGRNLLTDYPIDLVPKTGAVFKQIPKLSPRVQARRPPPGARICGRSGFRLEKVPEDAL